ncbi:MAG TPA: META domain-containing protein, partial [Candidatus Limnocylindrales bacterium]
MTRRLALVTVALALALVACSPGEDNANGGLAFTTWTVTSIAGTTTLPDAQPTMRFDPDGTLTGTDSCNQFSATFHTDGGSIEVSQTSSTMMACEPARMAQAQAFTAALTGATEWRETQTGELELRGHGDIVATPGIGEASSAAPPPPDSPLETSWVLVDLDGSTDFDEALRPTLVFADDGTLSGFAGCNTFDGSYALDGESIDIASLATTKMACEPPASTIE